MEFRHRFQVQAPLATVQRFHQQPESLVKLTPPPVRVRLHEAPSPPTDGDRMRFSLSLGPLRIPWTAVFSEVSEEGFTDNQLHGPYASWVHRHRFRPIDQSTTEISDHISVRIGLSPWAPVALALWLGMPLLFRHRVRTTRRELEEGPE